MCITIVNHQIKQKSPIESTLGTVDDKEVVWNYKGTTTGGHKAQVVGNECDVVWNISGKGEGVGVKEVHIVPECIKGTPF